MTRIGIVAALPAELAPLVKGWPLTGAVYTGQATLPDGSPATLYASAAGMGPAAATRAFAAIQAAAGSLDAVVSYGWSGALSCGVKPPDVFHPTEVIDTRTGERFLTANAPQPNPIRLVTLDHVARSDEKRPLAERYQAVLVDMEAATVARLARAHGIPFLCVKAISDGYLDILPDFNRFLDREGQLRIPAFVAHSLLRPRYWAPLARLGLNTRQAAQNLAVALPACLRPAALVSCQS
jgi:adenosylhomocysteine nucleosidase